MVTEIIKNLRYYTSTDLKTLKSMNATSQVCGQQINTRLINVFKAGNLPGLQRLMHFLQGTFYQQEYLKSLNCELIFE